MRSPNLSKGLQTSAEIRSAGMVFKAHDFHFIGGFKGVIPYQPFLAANRVKIKRADEFHSLAFIGFVIISEKLEAATYGKYHGAVFDFALYLLVRAGAEILQDKGLLKILTAADKNYIVIVFIQQFGRIKAIGHTINIPPFNSLLKAEDVARIAV